MNILKSKYPFDSAFKHHIYISLGLALWIFSFLYFTEPLDVNEFGDREKLIYLPFYGIIGGLSYALFLPLQSLMYRRNQQEWTLLTESLFILSYVLATSIIARMYYSIVVMEGNPNMYSLSYYIREILLPAIGIILPILLIARYSFGKYREKQIEDSKIEIEGEGTYDGLKLLSKDLIFIQSADNYIEVNYLSAGQLKKSLVRNKLSNIADNFPQLLRTHRSFIINPQHFVQWKSEKGKLYLELTHSIFAPVSNTYKSEVKRIFNSTTNKP